MLKLKLKARRNKEEKGKIGKGLKGSKSKRS